MPTGNPSPSIRPLAGSTCSPTVATRPSIRTRPAAISPSLARRDATPAAARIFWSRSSGIARAVESERLLERVHGIALALAAPGSGRARSAARALLGETRGDVGVKRRQVVERGQPEPLEEVEACPVEDRAARG